ncbi:MAG TPA: hypothetical protein VFD82_01565 [Planctomycetota bacterium]|nr:hypothetical protein [Planctomycetota bacterium]
MRLPFRVLATVCTASLATAQCAFSSVSMQGYGQGCNPVFAIDPTLAVALDTANCRLLLTVSAFTGCCNTFLVGTLLTLGVQPTSIPLPQFGVNCTLLVVPVILEFQPTAAGSTFVLQLPPTALPPVTLATQGGALYFTTIGLTYDFALSAGGQLTLQ